MHSWHLTHWYHLFSFTVLFLWTSSFSAIRHWIIFYFLNIIFNLASSGILLCFICRIVSLNLSYFCFSLLFFFHCDWKHLTQLAKTVPSTKGSKYWASFSYSYIYIYFEWKLNLPQFIQCTETHSFLSQQICAFLHDDPSRYLDVFSSVSTIHLSVSLWKACQSLRNLFLDHEFCLSLWLKFI